MTKLVRRHPACSENP